MLDLLKTAPVGGVELNPRRAAELEIGIMKIPTPNLHFVSHPPLKRNTVFNHPGGGQFLSRRNRFREIQHFLITGRALLRFLGAAHR